MLEGERGNIFYKKKHVLFRVEDKYRLSNVETHKLKSLLADILPIDRGETYTVSSLYFDDIYDQCYFDVVDGNPRREKFRVRTYNNNMKSIKLEHKVKRYNRILKDSVTISSDQLNALVNGQFGIWGDSDQDIYSVWMRAIIARKLEPKIIVTYERTAFMFSEGNVRITFDENLRGSKDISSFGSSSVFYEYPRGVETILEVKYDSFLPDFIGDIINSGTLWQTANSKYRICRDIF